MANFDISKCKYVNYAKETLNPYIEKTREPYKYYLETLKLAAYSLAKGDEEIAQPYYEAIVKSIENTLTDVPSAEYKPNEPKRIKSTAYGILEHVFRDALTIKTYDGLIIAPCYATGYFRYDFDNQYNSDSPYYRDREGVYDTTINTFWNTIKSSPDINLTEPDKNGYYSVINVREIAKSIESLVDSYYRTNPKQINNVLPNKEFQKEFQKLITTVQKKILITSTTYSSSYRF